MICGAKAGIYLFLKNAVVAGVRVRVRSRGGGGGLPNETDGDARRLG